MKGFLVKHFEKFLWFSLDQKPVKYYNICDGNKDTIRRKTRKLVLLLIFLVFVFEHNINSILKLIIYTFHSRNYSIFISLNYNYKILQCYADLQRTKDVLKKVIKHIFYLVIKKNY